MAMSRKRTMTARDLTADLLDLFCIGRFLSLILYKSPARKPDRAKIGTFFR